MEIMPGYEFCWPWIVMSELETEHGTQMEKYRVVECGFYQGMLCAFMKAGGVFSNAKHGSSMGP
jgi:hypothetical protein